MRKKSIELILFLPLFAVAQNSEKVQESQCVFELTPSQVEQIRNSR